MRGLGIPLNSYKPNFFLIKLQVSKFKLLKKNKIFIYLYIHTPKPYAFTPTVIFSPYPGNSLLLPSERIYRASGSKVLGT